MTNDTPTQLTYQGLQRQTPLPSCVLNRDDLRTLFRRLQEKCAEGIDLQIATWERPEDTPPDEWEKLRNRAREATNLTAMVFGAGGQQLVTTEEDGLLDRNLPDHITSVVFDSANALRSALNVDALNRFQLRLDFTSPSNFSDYDPTSRPTLNDSRFEITGPEDTWVSGVHDLVMQFFNDRKSPRGWIHSPTVFMLVHWLIVMPAAIWVSYRAVELLPDSVAHVHPAFTAGLYFYFFFLAFVAFRLLKLFGRRMWPYVELAGEKQNLGRGVFIAIAIGLVTTLIYDLGKHILT